MIVSSTAGGRSLWSAASRDLYAGANGAEPLRKKVLPQRDAPGMGCYEKHEFQKPGPGGPVRRNQQDLFLVLPDLAGGGSRRGRMCRIASVCLCTAENCWAESSTVSVTDEDDSFKWERFVGNRTLHLGNVNVPLSCPTIEGNEDGGGRRAASAEKGAVHNFISFSCTSGKKGTNHPTRESLGLGGVHAWPGKAWPSTLGLIQQWQQHPRGQPHRIFILRG